VISILITIAAILGIFSIWAGRCWYDWRAAAKDADRKAEGLESQLMGKQGELRTANGVKERQRKELGELKENVTLQERERTRLAYYLQIQHLGDYPYTCEKHGHIMLLPLLMPDGTVKWVCPMDRCGYVKSYDPVTRGHKATRPAGYDRRRFEALRKLGPPSHKAMAGKGEK